MSKYFTNLNPGAKVHCADGTVVDLNRMPVDTFAKKLYVSGFKHIGIKPDAIKILKGCPKLLLEKLIEQKKASKKISEVEILQSLLDEKPKTTPKKKNLKE